jgi:hypothetical protein
MPTGRAQESIDYGHCPGLDQDQCLGAHGAMSFEEIAQPFHPAERMRLSVS